MNEQPEPMGTNEEPSSARTNLETLQWLMDHIEGQVAFGDTKAGLLFTADSILLASLLAVSTSEQFGLESLSRPAVVLAGISCAALVGALFLALWTILPSRANLVRPDVAGRGLTNFPSIANSSAEAYIAKVMGATTVSFSDDAARSIHGKAGWARRKFRLLYGAITLTMLAVALGSFAAIFELLRS
ncbi:hypothetical protein EV643_101250 [Kribbella sp. VKM Ac-2527]|uniref:Pycsar effector protein domain-containing protein n=2 Tax=Kribbella caucasensis TaxID=2512215 RepID=A0A4R6KPM0_9ACTN|nr:hypothetical protein EV643_101250 [Kribbella sp. VKM Ac-2527]